MIEINKLHKRCTHLDMTFIPNLLPLSSTVLFWTEALYFAKEGETVMVAVYRDGYLGSATETVGKSSFTNRLRDILCHISIAVV